MDCSTPGFPVHRQPPELAQTHVHGVSDAIQPSHPLPSPSPLAFNLSLCLEHPFQQGVEAEMKSSINPYPQVICSILGGQGTLTQVLLRRKEKPGQTTVACRHMG